MMRTLARLVALVGPLVLLAPSTGASAASPAQAQGSAVDCRLVASPPTDYFGIIIPQGEVSCSSVQPRIHIEVTLERDGVAVAFAKRDCHKVTTCILSVDASILDVPGNQLWCTDATGRIRSQNLGESVGCEDQEF
jgi:hypothetical protein